MNQPEIIIIQDSREQIPLKFDHKFIIEVKIEKLNVGDYMVEFSDGHRPPIAFERKSINDLYGTLSQGYDRFKDCILRAKETGIQLVIIIEGSLTKVGYGHIHSSRSPESILYQLFTLYAKYGIWPVFCADSKEASEFITHIFIASEKKYINGD